MATKITGLTALTAPSADDILPIVDDPGGSPVTKKATLANLTANRLTGADSAVVANVNVIGGSLVLHRIDAAALTGDVDVVLTHKTRVIDVWCVASAAGGAGDTITVKNAGNAITDAIDLNVADKVVKRAGTIDDAFHEIAAGGTLRVSGASAVNAVVYVLGIRVA
jgi:hypothetical protein